MFMAYGYASNICYEQKNATLWLSVIRMAGLVKSDLTSNEFISKHHSHICIYNLHQFTLISCGSTMFTPQVFGFRDSNVPGTVSADTASTPSITWAWVSGSMPTSSSRATLWRLVTGRSRRGVIRS